MGIKEQLPGSSISTSKECSIIWLDSMLEGDTIEGEGISISHRLEPTRRNENRDDAPRSEGSYTLAQSLCVIASPHCKSSAR